MRDSSAKSHLEEKHESQGGKERLVDPGVKVLSPGLGQTQVKHVHVGLNVLEELDRVLLPAKPDQRLLCLLEPGLASEVEGRLWYEVDTE